MPAGLDPAPQEAARANSGSARIQSEEASMKDFKDKVAFITGGGSGVALGQAKVFADAVMKGLKEVIQPGYDPVDLAQKVKQAVINNDLYVIPYAEFREPLIELHKRVLAALPDPKDDPGMQARMAAMQKRRAERNDEAKR
jgi:hypothetical protein